MIIIGYQGIGKSTLATKNNRIIDLESSNFWKTDKDGNKTRTKDWYIYYCQIAEDLSKQGYIVFVSCHDEVRKFLIKNSSQSVCAIFPDICLEDKWIQQLEDRYEYTKLDKDLKALTFAKNNYHNSICKLYDDYNHKLFTDLEIIKLVNYNLKSLVDKLFLRDYKNKNKSAYSTFKDEFLINSLSEEVLSFNEVFEIFLDEVSNNLNDNELLDDKIKSDSYGFKNFLKMRNLQYI